MSRLARARQQIKAYLVETLSRKKVVGIKP